MCVFFRLLRHHSLINIVAFGANAFYRTSILMKVPSFQVIIQWSWHALWCPCLWFKPHFFILNFLPINNNNNGSSMGIIFWHLFLIVGGCLGSQTLNFAHMFQLVACFLKTTCVCLWTEKKRKKNPLSSSHVGSSSQAELFYFISISLSP